FFINSLAFHNAHLLRATLPQIYSLLFPSSQIDKQKHHELAAQLRDTRSTQLATRKAAAEKRKRGEEKNDENGGRPKKKRRTKGRAARKVVPVCRLHGRESGQAQDHPNPKGSSDTAGKRGGDRSRLIGRLGPLGNASIVRQRVLDIKSRNIKFHYILPGTQILKQHFGSWQNSGKLLW
ncbi:hypothetical protein B0H14DRAFT_2416895, partial [Mycena olivaceomarginata]